MLYILDDNVNRLMYGRQRKVEKDVWVSRSDFVDTCKLNLGCIIPVDSHSKTIPPKTLSMYHMPNTIPYYIRFSLLSLTF